MGFGFPVFLRILIFGGFVWLLAVLVCIGIISACVSAVLVLCLAFVIWFSVGDFGFLGLLFLF